ncbi:MAG: response regulator transcription factor [Chloroflexota bacterium]
MTQRLTVAVGGGHLLDRAALSALASGLPGLRVAALDSDPPPRVLVWDVSAGDLAELPHLPPGTALLLLVTTDDCSALLPGVAGLFSKDETPEALGIAIRQVARGEQYLSPSLALGLLQHQQAASSSVDPSALLSVAGQALSTLTDREREILTLLAEGLSNKAIAARLYLSVRTIEGHLANLYTRLGVHSRTEAALIAIQHNLRPPIR